MVNPKERMEKSGRRCSKVWKRESSWTREKELRFQLSVAEGEDSTRSKWIFAREHLKSVEVSINTSSIFTFPLPTHTA